MTLRDQLRHLRAYYKQYKYAFGFAAGVRCFYYTRLLPFLKSRPDRIVTLKVPSIKFPFQLRPESTDLRVFDEVIFSREYEETRIKSNFEPKLIFDLGSNIGLTAIYMANRYPNASIVAVEPEENNFQILKRNAAPYPNIRCIQGAVWNKNSELSINDVGGGAWAFQVSENNDPSSLPIKSYTVRELLEQSGHSSIDILKMDIEGAEKEVFSDNCDSWLANCKIIMIELHDRFKPGSGAAFFGAVSRFDFCFFHRGELDIVMQRDLVPT